MGSGSKPLSVRRFRLTTFNYASYPFLPVPSMELFGLAAAGVFVPVGVGKSPPCGFTVRPYRFVASTEPALPDIRLATDHLHLCRGDFPQCRTLSVVLLIPTSEGSSPVFNVMELQCNPISGFIVIAAPLLGLFIPFQLLGAHRRWVEGLSSADLGLNQTACSYKRGCCLVQF